MHGYMDIADILWKSIQNTWRLINGYNMDIMQTNKGVYNYMSNGIYMQNGDIVGTWRY